MRSQHLLVLLSEKRDGSEDEFEEFEIEIGSLEIISHLIHALEQILDEDGGEGRRRRHVGEERVGDDL